MPEIIGLSDGRVIRFALEGDIGFAGRDPESGAGFTGRAAAGASVTVTLPRGAAFQYAMLEWEG